MKLILPKKYLSYSALSLWKKDKHLFQQKYYEGIELPDTRYTLFGKEIALALESGKYPQVPRYKKSEYAMNVLIEDIPILGYLDSFSPQRRAFLEYKSGIRHLNGDARWTQLAVQQWDQLPFYSLLIKEKFGRVQNQCKLIWLETRNKEVQEQIGSHVVETYSNELELTGHMEIFKRSIEEWERDRMREWIIKSALEISKDYATFKKKA